MKFEVQEGEEFVIKGEAVVTVRTIRKQDEEVVKPSLFADWKVTAVVAVFTLLFSSGVYAAATGDASLFEKFLEAVVKVASKPPEGKHAKESD